MADFQVSESHLPPTATALSTASQQMNLEYAEWFKHKPARSCVAVKQLPKGVDVEIECIALP